MLENQTFLAPLLPFWEKGLGDEGRISVYAFALSSQVVVVDANPKDEKIVDWIDRIENWRCSCCAPSLPARGNLRWTAPDRFDFMAEISPYPR
jgi:hypothetical protein